MKVVLDTSVLLSAVISAGRSSRLVNAWYDKSVFELLISGRLLQELRDVMLRENSSYQFLPAEADRYLTGLFRRGQFVTWSESEVQTIPKVIKDPKDDHVVILTVRGKADVIVSNDNHLLELKEIRFAEQKIPIVTARQFLTWLEGSGIRVHDGHAIFSNWLNERTSIAVY